MTSILQVFLICFISTLLPGRVLGQDNGTNSSVTNSSSQLPRKPEFEPGHSPIKGLSKGEPGFNFGPFKVSHTDATALPYKSGVVYDRNGRALGDGAEYEFKEDFLLPLETPSGKQKVSFQDTRPAIAAWSPHCLLKISKAYTPDEAREILKDRKPRVGKNSWFSGNGYFTVITDVVAGTMNIMLCKADTEIDITNLREARSELIFYGYSWRPKAKGEALILVTQDEVIGVNVTAKPIAQ